MRFDLLDYSFKPEVGTPCSCVPKMVEFFHDYCVKLITQPPDGVKNAIQPEVTRKSPLEVASRIDGWLKDDVGYFRPDTELPMIDRPEDTLAHPSPDSDITISICVPGINCMK